MILPPSGLWRDWCCVAWGWCGLMARRRRGDQLGGVCGDRGLCMRRDWNEVEDEEEGGTCGVQASPEAR